MSDPEVVRRAVDSTAAVMDEAPALRLLLHRLNNALGIILANAELLESKAADEINRARASQMVASALDAMGTAKEIGAALRPKP